MEDNIPEHAENDEDHLTKPLESITEEPQLLLNNNFTCSICDQICDSASNLIKHRNELHGSKKYQCMNCGNGFTTTRGLRLHLRLHTGEKPEACSFCPKKFSDPRTRK